MDMQQIIDAARGFDGAFVVTPEIDSAFPAVAWGDAFFYYAPDRVMPERTQPYATIITKDYPDDDNSRLDEPDRFRVNIHVGREQAAVLATTAADPSATDVFFPHPLYGAMGWVSVVNPAERTSTAVVRLLREAHEAARVRSARRGPRS